MGQHLPHPGGLSWPQHQPSSPQWCREEEADAPGHPPVRGPAHQWRGDATRGGHGSGGATGPLCLAELCRHRELAAGVAARDLSGQDLLLPDKPAAGTSSAPRGAAPNSSLPPTAAPRGQLHGSQHRTHTGHRPMLPAQLPRLAGLQAGIPRHCPWLQPHSSHRSAEHGAEPVCAGRARQRGSTWHSTAWHDAELVVSLGPSLLSSSAGPTSAGATTAAASGHGSMWWGHIYSSELQHAEPGSARSCPNHGTLPAQDGMGFAGRQQLDPATSWQHSPGWLPRTAQLPG